MLVLGGVRESFWQWGRFDVRIEAAARCWQWSPA